MASTLRSKACLCAWLLAALTSPGTAQRPDFSAASAAPPASQPAAQDSGPAPAGANGLAWQIALDRAGFSPGVIDGHPGSKTRLSTHEFQQAHGLPATGELDEATAAALNVRPDHTTIRYTILAGDLDKIGPSPKDWNAKSKLDYLGYESLEAALAEKFHCTRALLAQLNEGTDISSLQAGDKITAPAVGEPAGETAPIARGDLIVVNLSEKAIRIYKNDKLVGLFFCSIAAKQSKRPSGSARVVVIADNPTYMFDPEMWPEVHNVDHKLLIPPGPRNPVGLCWVGLNLPGYGMHGTPNPELIGKTGSHGCFRLANWDAQRLGKMVQVGTPVKFLD